VKDLVQSRRTPAEIAASVLLERERFRDAIDAFHRVFYASENTHGLTYFEGVPILKNPLDLWIYQEILWHLRPTLLIETGTAMGGSALWFARQFDKLGVGHVVSIDIEAAPELPQHPRITYLPGSSTCLSMLEAVGACAKDHPRVMVVLDSDHSASHVTDELDTYAPMVTPGQYLVVEDTNINGRPIALDWHGGPGPGPAVDAWIQDHPEFIQDPLSERFLVTFFPGGWLKKREDACAAA